VSVRQVSSVLTRLCAVQFSTAIEGRELLAVQAGAPVSVAAASPNGRWVATVDAQTGGRLRLWRLTDGKLLRDLGPTHDGARWRRWGSRGEMMLSGAMDRLCVFFGLGAGFVDGRHCRRRGATYSFVEDFRIGMRLGVVVFETVMWVLFPSYWDLLSHSNKTKQSHRKNDVRKQTPIVLSVSDTLSGQIWASTFVSKSMTEKIVLSKIAPNLETCPVLVAFYFCVWRIKYVWEKRFGIQTSLISSSHHHGATCRRISAGQHAG
jgi:hypothetical protein